MPSKQQLRDAANDIATLSDTATDALENLIEECGSSLDEMEAGACNEAESQLWADDDCFSYLQDNNLTNWNEAIDGGCSDVEGIARFYLEQELTNAIDYLRSVDFELDYPEEGEEDEEEGE